MFERIVSASFGVRTAGEPVNIEMMLPDGCSEGYELAVVASPGPMRLLQMRSTLPLQFGMLSLRQDGPGDIFFQVPVRGKVGDASPQPGPPFAQALPAHPPLWMPVKVKCSLRRLMVHYRDTANAASMLPETYLIHIYLKCR